MTHKLTIIVLLMLFCCRVAAQQAKSKNELQPTVQQSADTTVATAMPKANNTKLTYKLIDAPNKTYCYDIYADGKLIIHQPNIPAVPGNDGFKTKADAEKVAKLVIKKIKKGEMPPTVTVEEMKKMNVIK